LISFYIFRQIKYEKIEALKDPSISEINEDINKSDQLNLVRDKENIIKYECVPSGEKNVKEKKITLGKEKKNYSKQYKCEQCDNKYTWYSGLANHKRFVHTKQKGK
jgi:hypothetical protein